jgi:putative component of membrane protein insertase Oxa1/YidC/SpoIIIJ protein YidD
VLGLPTDSLDTEVSVDFLPVLTQLVCLENARVQEIATRSAILVFDRISWSECQALGLPYIVPCETSVWEKFLIAILIAHHENSIPSDYQRTLDPFLTETCEASSACAILALAILARGFSAWIGRSSRRGLYQIIIRGILRQRQANGLDQQFCSLACADVDTFLEVFPALLAEMTDDNRFIGLFDLYTRLAIQKTKVFGGLIASNFAKACQDFPQLSKYVMEELQRHAGRFGFVAWDAGVCVIGNPDGTVIAVRDGKIMFDEKLSEWGIDLVAIGPDAMFAAAASVEAKLAWLLRLQSSQGWFRKKVVVSRQTVGDLHGGSAIAWTRQDQFSVRDVQKAGLDGGADSADWSGHLEVWKMK